MAEIKDLMENKDFAEKLTATKTTEEVIAVFADFGVSVTEAELDAAVAQVGSKGDELGEDDLNAVSGGIVAGCVALGGLLLQLGDRLGTWDWWRKRLGI